MKIKDETWQTAIKNENYSMGLLELCGKCGDDFVVAIWFPLLYCIRQGKQVTERGPK